MEAVEDEDGNQTCRSFDWRAMELAFYAEMTPDEQTRRNSGVPQADPIGMRPAGTGRRAV